jgi:hypothetical protein
VLSVGGAYYLLIEKKPASSGAGFSVRELERRCGTSLPKDRSYTDSLRVVFVLCSLLVVTSFSSSFSM